ncbi:MAG TPA: class I SAM-dependent methyltransferase [Chryseosolibacter sp.]
MASKDLFSSQSKAYAAFRPTYPADLYQFIFRHTQNFDCAWDCATGNGQVARDLSLRFKKVFATDISQQQLDEAFRAENIEYSISKAERTSFAAKQFDLITVGQALHWINTDEFYKEVKRVGRHGATLAVWGYSLLTITEPLDIRFSEFYFNTVGKYWDAARKLVENKYSTIDFPFNNRIEHEFEIKVEWNLEQFAGYLTSWSSTQKFINVERQNPVPDFIQSIRQYWDEGEIKTVRFPLFVKVGKI